MNSLAFGKGLIGLSKWSQIIDPDLDHPKGIHPDNLGNTYW